MFYYLKHRNDTVAILSIDDGTDHLTGIEAVPEHRKWLPFLGNADKKRMARWIAGRSIPATRDQIESVLLEAGCRTRAEYLFKNLALSVTDAYWIVPVELDLSWEEVSPFRSFSGKRMPLHNDSSYSPNASLGGQMSKYIDLHGDKPRLIKRTDRHYGLQCLNEVFASRTHAKQDNGIPYVDYHAEYDPETGYYSCECSLFTSEDPETSKGTEFIPAYEILLAQKQPNDVSTYDYYIHICEQRGIADARKFMDYMTAADFVLTNTDRHLNNFGILRDSVTGDFLSMAPIFDSGNAMFYDQNLTRPMTREELLNIRITAFHDREEKMLRHVKDRHAFRIDLAIPPERLQEFLASSNVPEQIAAAITENYKMKLQMLCEYQDGASLSRYKEKKKAATGRNGKGKITINLEF